MMAFESFSAVRVMTLVYHSKAGSVGPAASGFDQQTKDVLAAVENLVGDGRKAKGGSILRYSGVEVGGLDIPDARRIGVCRVKVGVTEAEGITTSAVEVLKVKTGVSLAKEVISELKAGRRREARTAC